MMRRVPAFTAGEAGEGRWPPEACQKIRSEIPSLTTRIIIKGQDLNNPPSPNPRKRMTLRSHLRKVRKF